ncbi:MAG: ABC transporter ATP-binding protein [Alphaproteobacteria bacterium]
MSEILRIEKLRIVLGGQHVLRDASLGVPAGTVHGLVGESGAGKTMIGKAVLGILPSAARITGGSIRFETQDIALLGERARRSLLGRAIAMIPQDPMSSLNPTFRIGSQIADVLRLHLGMSAKAARARALELLHQVYIREPERVLRQYPHELSGGMRQRVLIAIAFACRPRLIVADEPSTALDVTVQRQVLRLIKELQAQENTAVLLITHDLGVVAKICDTMTVLHGGRVLEDGPVAACFERPSHPYTRALMAVTPRYDRPADELRPVPDSLSRELMAEDAAWDRDHGAA